MVVALFPKELDPSRRRLILIHINDVSDAAGERANALVGSEASRLVARQAVEQRCLSLVNAQQALPQHSPEHAQPETHDETSSPLFAFGNDTGVVVAALAKELAADPGDTPAAIRPALGFPVSRLRQLRATASHRTLMACAVEL
jgi:hypothetical protein